MRARHGIFCLSAIVTGGMALSALAPLGLSLSSDYYSHIPLIPLISAYLLYQENASAFESQDSSLLLGGSLAATAIVLYAAATWSHTSNPQDASTVGAFSSLLFLVGAFVALYGLRAFRRSAFPFLFLLFTIPVPSALMEQIIYFLQTGSAEVADVIFTASGVSFLREGFSFHFSRFSIEVAKQCSGIRSSLALAITTVLAAHLFLRVAWHKAVLIASIIPLVLLKNGMRIAVLTFLGLYVDPQVLVDGFLHRSGGIFFFIPVLVLMGAMLGLLRKLDGSRNRAKARSLLVPPARTLR